jgi:hypothetical protein
VAPDWWLILDVRQDGGAACVRLRLEKYPNEWTTDEIAVRSWRPDLPWSTARDIGRSSVNTRHLRIFRGWIYWALEADHSEIHLAEQQQVNDYLARGLPVLVEDAYVWLRRQSR